MFRLVCLVVFLLNMCVPQGKFDGVVAIVGNNIILHSDVFQQAQIVASSRRVDMVNSPYLFEEIYLGTLNNIIDQYAVLNIAEKDTNLVVSDDEVDRALSRQIDDFISRAGSEDNFVEMVGMSMRQIKADYWNDIRDMMVVERYQYSKIQNIDVSRIEVDSFYDSVKDSLPAIPEQFEFSVIEVPFVAGKGSGEAVIKFLNSLREMIVSGTASFDSLAKTHSQDPGSGPTGGNLGFTERGSLVKEYEEVAYSMAPGEISLPIKSQFGYHLIRVIEKRGEKLSSQHILRLLDFSNEDKRAALGLIQNISLQAHNDPFVFDSIALDFSNRYNNFSGRFNDLSPDNIPYNIYAELGLLKGFEMSSSFETKNGYAILFLYHHSEELFPTPDNFYNLIYQYAKQEKQNRIFKDWVGDIKNNTYIKFFYD